MNRSGCSVFRLFAEYEQFAENQLFMLFGVRIVCESDFNLTFSYLIVLK